MKFNLTGRTAVVTGASTGIGLTVVRLLAASGARLPPTCGWAATASTAARPRRNPFGPRPRWACRRAAIRRGDWIVLLPHYVIHPARRLTIKNRRSGCLRAERHCRCGRARRLILWRRARSRRDGYDLLACTGLSLYAGTIRRLG